MRSIILFVSILSLSMSVRAACPDDDQDTDPKRWKKGFIVTLHGDTVEGKVKTPDFLDVYYDYQRTVAFRDQKGIAHYSPNDLTSFSYYEESDNNPVTLQSVSSPEGDGHVFLRLYCSGGCKVYGLTITEMKGTGPIAVEGQVRSSLIPREKKYIQIGGSEFFPLRRIGFKKTMKEAFASCPHILAALESKEYTYDNWQALVRDYNSNCK